MNKIIELIKRRGFLIEKVDDVYLLSDNSHALDAGYLNKLLRQFNIGCVDSNKIIISNIFNYEKLFTLFQPAEGIRKEMRWSTVYNWNKFKYYKHGKKVPVEVLEPNIARYCKAISACGLDTISSCDGNHFKPHSTEIYIYFESGSYKIWHALLWKHILQEKFLLNWDSNYLKIEVNISQLQNTYDILNDAAEYLYENRMYFRSLKNNASAFLTKKYRHNHTNEEIIQALEKELVSILMKTRPKELS